MLRWFYYVAQQFRWVLDQESIQRYPRPVGNKRQHCYGRFFFLWYTRQFLQKIFFIIFTSTLMKVELVEWYIETENQR